MEKSFIEQCKNDGVEVDLDKLEHILSWKDPEQMENEVFVDLREESLQDSTKDPVLDYTQEERSDFTTTNLLERDVMQNDATGCTDVPFPLEESQRNFALPPDRPEHQGEELEEPQGQSWEQRCSEVSRELQQTRHHLRVSEAAGSVRRRYRSWHKSAQKRRTNSSHVDRRAVPKSILEDPNQSPKLRRSHRGDKQHVPSDSVTQASRSDNDDDFVKFCHQFVCLSKSSVPKGPPCRYCREDQERRYQQGAF